MATVEDVVKMLQKFEKTEQIQTNEGPEEHQINVEIDCFWVTNVQC